MPEHAPRTETHDDKTPTELSPIIKIAENKVDLSDYTTVTPARLERQGQLARAEAARQDAMLLAALTATDQEIDALVARHNDADHKHHEREHAAADSVAQQLRPAIDKAVKATNKSGRPKSFRMIGPLNPFGNWKLKRAVRTGLHDDILPINSADRALAELADDYPNHTLTCKQNKHGGVVIYVERKPATPRT